MRLTRLASWLRSEVAETQVPRQAGGGDAYELVDVLARGPARAAAWSAYALQTYGDKLLEANRDGFVDGEAAGVAADAFALAARCVEAAKRGDGLSGLPQTLPRWRSLRRSEEQLTGMRNTLEALRTYIAYELRDHDDASAHAPGLAKVDAELRQVERLWVARESPDIRGGLGSALSHGLDRAYSLGRAVTGG
jgi:hypothetical protein